MPNFLTPIVSTASFLLQVWSNVVQIPKLRLYNINGDFSFVVNAAWDGINTWTKDDNTGRSLRLTIGNTGSITFNYLDIGKTLESDWKSFFVSAYNGTTTFTGGNINVYSGKIREEGNDLIPPGVMMPYAGSSAPGGYLLCNGDPVSRTTYADLFAAIGTNYGAGNGSTTFNLPDLRGRVPVGVDGTANRLSANDALGNSSGFEKHSLSYGETGVPPHGHTASQVAHAHTVDGPPRSYGEVQSGSSVRDSTNTAVAITAWWSSSIAPAITVASHAGTAATAHNNMQPYQVVNYIIKT